jgi:hypothetical protein
MSDGPRLAMKALGLLALLAAAVIVAVGYWLLVQALVDPEPYQDPEMRGLVVAGD